MAVALIPMKDLPRAKARLASVLDEHGRRQLAVALYRDVLAAALACPALGEVAAVTRDADALAIAAEAGATGMPEPGDLNGALTSAARARQDAGRLVILAADLPLASPHDIRAVAEAEADVAIVRSGDGGTNALAMPPDAFELHFGPESAQRHLDAAERAGLQSISLDVPGLALDIDTPADVDRLRAALEGSQRPGRYTLEALEHLGLIAPSVRGG